MLLFGISAKFHISATLDGNLLALKYIWCVSRFWQARTKQPRELILPCILVQLGSLTELSQCENYFRTFGSRGNPVSSVLNTWEGFLSQLFSSSVTSRISNNNNIREGRAVTCSRTFQWQRQKASNQPRDTTMNISSKNLHNNNCNDLKVTPSIPNGSTEVSPPLGQ